MPQTKNNSAQGSMEYLLLIGGVVLVAVVVILLLLQTSQSAGSEVNATAEGGVARMKEEAGIALGELDTVVKLDSGKIGAPTGAANLSGFATGILKPPSGNGGSEGGGIDGGEDGGSVGALFTFNQGGGNIQRDLPEVKEQ
ncbi:MAG: class III signal peptide-containing protein [Candidatus Diapherotrites archaeon]